MGLLANVPTLSYVQWKNLLIIYKDVTYQIENSHTNKPFIYWDVNNPYVLTTSNIKLEDRTGLFYVLFNDSGSYLVIPNDEVDIEFSENPSRDVITERIVGLSNNTKDQFASVQVDVDGIKTTVAKCQEDINGHTQTISSIEQKTDEIDLEIESIERQYNLDKDAQTIRDNFSDAILNLQSTLGLFSSDMNVYMEDNKLSDNEKDKIEVYKESIETAKENINTQLDIIAEYFNTTEGEDNEKMIHLNTAKGDLNTSINNLLTNIDAVGTDGIFTNEEMTAIVTYFGKVNVEINECKNLIDEYIILGIGGTLIEQVANINLRQDQIKLQVSERYYSKSEVDELVENVDIGLVVRNIEVMYYFSTSSTKLENGEWTSSMPEIKLNRYIWSKTVTIYSDGTSTETEPMCITSTSNYTWIKYSDNSNGSNMYDAPNENTTYIGIASNKDVSIESDNPNDYEWSRFRGIDGIDYYTWIKYADDENGNGISNDPTDKYYIGFAYNKSTSVESNNPSDYTWSKFKGVDGVDGTGIKILGIYETLEELNNAHPNNNEIGDTYSINGDLYVWFGSAFENIGGIKGEDGQTFYTWIKYSDNANGSNMYDIPNENTLYIGIATNKTTNIESTKPSDYTWSKFRGEDGIDGLTFYTWIKYSDNSNGSNMYNEPNENTSYIGIATNKTTNIESNNPSDYTWSKFKGADGIDGTNGKGVVGIVDYYKVHTSNIGITNESGGFSTDVPQMDSTNKYLWSYELITYTDDTITKTSARVIGVFGTDGKGIERVVEYYAVGSSNTVAPTNFSTTIPTFGGEDRFLWNYEIIYYNDGTSIESNKRIIGVKGEKGDKGDGLRNVVSEFYLSISKEEPMGGQWSETPPKWEIGKYMWTRSKLIYSNGSFEYTPPICNPDWEAYSDLKNLVETTVDKYSDIDITLDGITSRVSSTEETITTLNGTVVSMETRISSAEEKITDDAIINTVSSTYSTKAETERAINGMQTQISTVEQTANKINWLVKSGTSESNMTLTDNMYTLIAENINLTGYVTFSDLSTVGKTTISGSNITTGTIDASKVKVTNLDASNITAGYISGGRISGGTIDASVVAVTNLDASNITSGYISASRISGGTIDASVIKVDNLDASNITTGKVNGYYIDSSNLSTRGELITGQINGLSGIKFADGAVISSCDSQIVGKKGINISSPYIRMTGGFVDIASPTFTGRVNGSSWSISTSGDLSCSSISCSGTISGKLSASGTFSCSSISCSGTISGSYIDSASYGSFGGTIYSYGGVQGYGNGSNTWTITSGGVAYFTQVISSYSLSNVSVTASAPNKQETLNIIDSIDVVDTKEGFRLAKNNKTKDIKNNRCVKIKEDNSMEIDLVESVSVLWEAVKKIKQEKEEKEEEVKELNDTIASLEERIKELENKLNK